MLVDGYRESHPGENESSPVNRENDRSQIPPSGVQLEFGRSAGYPPSRSDVRQADVLPPGSHGFRSSTHDQPIRPRLHSLYLHRRVQIMENAGGVYSLSRRDLAGRAEISAQGAFSYGIAGCVD